MKRNAQTKPPVIYKTPGQECSHADKGCCPPCMAGPRFHRRFFSRKPMPAAH